MNGDGILCLCSITKNRSGETDCFPKISNCFFMVYNYRLFKCLASKNVYIIALISHSTELNSNITKKFKSKLMIVFNHSFYWNVENPNRENRHKCVTDIACKKQQQQTKFRVLWNCINLVYVILTIPPSHFTTWIQKIYL